jgi:hypothetical protein
MSLEYDSTRVIAPFDPSPWLYTCLSVTGFNQMRTTIQAIQGNVQLPGVSFQGRNRDGFDSPNSGEIGVALEGYRSHLFSINSLTFYDFSGNSTQLIGTATVPRILYLPDTSGTLAVGVPDLATHVLFDRTVESPDGSRTSFSLPSPYKKILDVRINGLGDNDFTQTVGTSSSTFTLAGSTTGDQISVLYIKDY